MSRLMMTVKGSPKDHVAVSDPLPDEEAAKQLATAGRYVGKVGTLQLPWITAHGTNILSVQMIDDR